MSENLPNAIGLAALTSHARARPASEYEMPSVNNWENWNWLLDHLRDVFCFGVADEGGFVRALSPASCTGDAS